MKKLKGFVILIACALSVLSCKKDSEPTAQELLDKGENISTILTLKPADSLIGKSYLGGYIFYIDTATATGKIVGGSDVSETASWGCTGQDMTGAEEAEFGFGAANTDFIVQNCTLLNTAAKLCANSSENGFTDWYLPSEEELELVYDVLGAKNIGGFGEDYYWTSTQTTAATNSAQHVLFVDGSISFSNKSNVHRVRAVRDF